METLVLTIAFTLGVVAVPFILGAAIRRQESKRQRIQSRRQRRREWRQMQQYRAARDGLATITRRTP